MFPSGSQNELELLKAEKQHRKANQTKHFVVVRVTMMQWNVKM